MLKKRDVLWKIEELTGKHCRAKCNAERRRQGVLGVPVNTNETKRGRQSAATVIILANNTQQSTIAIHSPPHLQSAMQQERSATGNSSSAPSPSLALLQGQGHQPAPGAVRALAVLSTAAQGVAKQDRSTWAVCPHPPQQPPTKARAAKSSQRATKSTKCPWKTGNVGDYVTSNSHQAIIKCTQELQNNLKHKLAFKACFLPHQGNVTTLPCRLGSG